MKKLLLFFLLSTIISLSVLGTDILVVYCGITMEKPMREIADIIEIQHGCKVKLVTGGSEDLMNILLRSKNGDLFLPGSDAYISQLEKDYPELVVKKAKVGVNRAALFVQKGNPKNIANDLDLLLNTDYRVIIGAANKGSIGKTTKSILDKKGIYEEVVERALIAVDSEGLINAFKADKADISVNWYAASTWPENRDIVDAVTLPSEYEARKNLVLSVLSTSKYTGIAESFFSLASSEEGFKIFDKYGFGY